MSRIESGIMSNLIMYNLNDLDSDYVNEFSKLGITDEGEMVGLLNLFDSIAEIGYALYNDGINEEEYE